ncbi:phycobilisome rod-core linker polypeptide [filamentous cyanobacterium LEGE 11480]|uniref:Phycobilisome rod-core linker polypeptide n=2 Tax=Romeriopsis TaxID=2992131 RepID=A0A928VPK3_9CYAN|nr:phycobilisome rod-core linker polypeptide [Romeriopsis navalis LEGE 11480]
MANQPSAVLPVKGASADWLRTAVINIVNRPATSDQSISTAEDPIRQEQFYSAYQPFKEADKVEFIPGASDAEAEVVIRAIYRQVMGNAHVMESERLTTLESRFKGGELTVREFVRALAKSELYRSRFFDNCYSYRAVELNFKHLLGRAPDNFDETRFHTGILDTKGFEADIDSYIDSDEYQSNFGEYIVPAYRGFSSRPGQSMLEFTNMFDILRSASSSDKAQTKENKPQLTSAIIRNSPYGKFKADNVQDLLAEVFKGSIGSAPIPKPDGTYEQPDISRTSSEVPEAARRQIAALEQQVEDQAAEIAALKAQLADATRISSFGSAQLNKWRPRSY